MTFPDATGAARGLFIIAVGAGVEALAAIALQFVGLNFALPVGWLVAAGLMVVGLVQLALSSDEPESLWLTAICVVVSASLSFATLALQRTELVSFIASPWMSVIANGGLLFSLVERGALAWVLFRIACGRHAWLALLMFGVMLVRTAYVAALTWGLVDLPSLGWLFPVVMSVPSLVSALAIITLTMLARST